MSSRLPVVAIVGHPNVGKSTFFNWLTHTRKALVFNEPGSTRDRQYGRGRFKTRDREIETILVDTGGFTEEAKKQDEIELGINRQVERALEEADVILAMFDGRAGVAPHDKALVNRLRSISKPVFYLVNKIDDDKAQMHVGPFYELGLGDIFPVSCEHHKGLEALTQKMLPYLENLPEITLESDTTVGRTDDDPIELAIIGRPNVGKSTLLNALLDDDRAVVSPIPGTTRDNVDAIIRHRGVVYRLVDTAGIRRKSKTEGLEGLSVIKSLHAIEKAHLIVLVLDLDEGVTEQDAKIARKAHDEGRGLVIFGNKMDLLKKREARVKTKDLVEGIYHQLPFIRYAPIIMGSALKNLFPRERFFADLGKIERARRMTIPTPELNDYLDEVLRKRTLPLREGKRLKIYYMTQAVAYGEKRGLRPSTPTFVCFVNTPEAVKDEDERFLANSIRKRYEFYGNPIVLRFRPRGGIDKTT